LNKRFLTISSFSRRWILDNLCLGCGRRFTLETRQLTRLIHVSDHFVKEDVPPTVY
jgi:hypothetical protein